MTSQYVALMGDTHASKKAFALSQQEIMDFHQYQGEVIATISVGDFGFWPRQPLGQEFLDYVGSKSEVIPTFFIDGNHEDHSLLGHSADDFMMVRPNLYYIPRGYAFGFGSIRFLALGGAWSIDRIFRIEGETWFWNEEPDKADIDRACLAAEEGVDVLLTHDCTSMAFPHFVAGEPTSQNSGTRRAIDHLVDLGRPSFNIHGHHHIAATLDLRTTSGHEFQSIGLSADGDKGSVCFLKVSGNALECIAGTKGENPRPER